MINLRTNIIFSCFFLGLLFTGYNTSLKSCIFASEVDILTRAMPVKTIEEIEQNHTRISFTINVSTPNPCWEFHEAQVVRSGNEVWVKIIGAIEEDINCIQILGEFTTSVVVTFSSPGDYLVHFWKSDTTSIDTSVSVE